MAPRPLLVRYGIVTGILLLLLLTIVHVRRALHDPEWIRWTNGIYESIMPKSIEVRWVAIDATTLNMGNDVRKSNAKNRCPRDLVGLVEYAKIRLSQPRNHDDIFELGLRMRALKAYLEAFPGESPFPMSKKNVTVYGSPYEFLERGDFAWVYKSFSSLFDLRSSFTQKRGIVIPTGIEYFRFAVHLIRSIRRLHNCSLPIQVYHLGDADLPAKYRSFLQKELAVETVDITQIFDNTLLQLKGWDIKPFALLAAPFQQVMLLDADTVLLQSPDAFFLDPGFRTSGALFFHDRTLFPTDPFKQAWLASMFPKPLPDALTSLRFFQMHTTYEQEAGVVLLDKSRNYAAALAVCRLNAPPERDIVLHTETHGDKESFWLGFLLTNSTFAFMPSLPGSIGRPQPDYETGKPALCGKLAHFDRQGRLMWFNDAIVDNKKDSEGQATVSEMTHYGKEGKWSQFLCLDTSFMPLEDDVKAKLGNLTDLFNLPVKIT